MVLYRILTIHLEIMLSIDRSNVVLAACKAQKTKLKFLLQQIFHVVLTVEEPTAADMSVLLSQSLSSAQ